MLSNYLMNGQRLKIMREEKDLGVKITDDVKIEMQCSVACAKANRMLELIRRTKSRVARLRHGKYGRFKENGEVYAKWHRTYSKMICRNMGDPVKHGRSGNPN